MGYIEMQHSYKRYHMGNSVIEANRDVSFSIEKGELAMILGSSGAGKSTVLNILGGMDTNDESKVLIDGRDIAGYSETERITYRRNDVGFVFQFYNLIQNLTAKENVELASEIENFFGLRKSELLYLQEFHSMEHFKQELVEYLDYYNNRRIKAKLKGLPPAIHRQQALSAA